MNMRDMGELLIGLPALGCPLCLGLTDTSLGLLTLAFLCSPLRPSRRHFPRVMPLSKPGR